ncbi:MAG TPA: HAD-IIB family hydrolase, partial [Chloroflexota bacterium]
MVTPSPASQPAVRLVIADVDGTLVTTDKVLTPRAISAVSSLRAASVLFAITSGRPPKGMKMIIDPLQLSEPIAAFNGGVVVNPDLSVIESHLLGADVTPGIIRLIGEHGLDVWLYSETEWYVHDANAPHV